MVVIQGPRFSSAAESLWFTRMGWDVVNMTQYPEVSLARELQMCYAALAFPTDFDSGVILDSKIKPVSERDVARVFNENITKAKKIILEIVEDLPKDFECNCQNSLSEARF